MEEKKPLFILTLLVTFIAIANFARLLWNIPITIGTIFLPGWTGAIFYVLLGLLAAWSFRALFSTPSSRLTIVDTDEKNRK